MHEDPEHIDRLMDEGEEFMEERAHRAGIDKDLIKLTSMSDKQARALERFTFYSTDISGEEKQHLKAAVIRMLVGIRLLRDEMSALKWKVKESQGASRGQSYLIAAILCVVLAMIGILKFNDFKITVDPNDGTVVAIESSLWGFTKKEREIKWLKIDDYDFPGWMAKGHDGKWYLYIHEDDLLPQE